MNMFVFRIGLRDKINLVNYALTRGKGSKCIAWNGGVLAGDNMLK